MTLKINDPITLEIIQNSLQAAADEMFASMRKTAMSSIIYEVLDMGTGIMDAHGELATSGAGIPAFIGVLDKSAKVIVEKFSRSGDIGPGDVFATNDPYHGGVTHLNDIVVIMPVFVDGELLAWCGNIAHHSDVGGMAPGSLSGEAVSIYQEGLRLPAVKIIEGGEPLVPVMEIIKSNSRMPDVLEGDLWAAIASVRIGGRRLALPGEEVWCRHIRRGNGFVHGLWRAIFAQGTSEASAGHIRAFGSAGRWSSVQCESHDSRRQFHSRLARQSGSIRQSAQHEPRWSDGCSANDFQVAYGSVFARKRWLVSADQASNAAGVRVSRS